MPESEPPSSAHAPTPEQLKRALQAFKKRLKLTRLDAESGLGGGAMSGGKTSGIMSITPPSQYPKTIWDELVKLGKLNYSGHGLYELTKR
jgi:hypothetical protein